MSTSSSRAVGGTGAGPEPGHARARSVAVLAVRLAAVTGRVLPRDLRLWALAGGMPELDDGPVPPPQGALPRGAAWPGPEAWPGDLPAGGAEAGPGDSPVGPGDSPVGPGELPVGPGDSPVGPGDADAGPGDLPVGPGDSPVRPGEVPTDGDLVTALAGALEAATGADQRRANGLHVTPRWLADHLFVLALEGLGATPACTVCDPACGGGAFLLAAARRLHRRGADRRRIVRHLLWGADIDPVGLAVAEAALALWAGEAPPPGRLVVADTLVGGAALWPDPPAAGFDVVVGNPPFQNQLGRATARSAAERQRLRRRYGPAVRAYTDTAWLFLLAGCDLARPGGRVALVQPQSVVAARDAAAVRAAIDSRARLRDIWVDERPVFAAAVRVCAPVLERLPNPAATPVPAPETGNAWTDRFAAAIGVPRAELKAAGTLADLATVIAGFRDQYYSLVELVAEHATAAAARPPGMARMAPLVTSGLIDWLACAWGRRPARFAKRTWRAPAVDLAHLERHGTPAARRWVERTRVPKILVATQTRVVEAAVDTGGAWVPSVPVVAVVPRDAADLWRLAAALTSPAVTAWLLRRAPGTALARGALKVAAPNLLALPLPADRPAWDAAATAVRAFVAGPSEEGRERFLVAAARAYGTPDSITSWWRARAGALPGDPPLPA